MSERARGRTRRRPGERGARSTHHVPFPEEDNGGPKPPEQTGSYTMVDPRFREIYFQFYKETYKPSVLDRKTKELIAIAASLTAKCQGCLEGHIKKALKFGATREEISETHRDRDRRQRRGRGRPDRHRGRQHGHQAVLSGRAEPPGALRAAERLLRLRPREREGPAHPELRAEGDVVVADWTPEPHHEAFPGVLNGGIVGALLDCHSNWTAAHAPDGAPAAGQPPCTVTADFAVKLDAARRRANAPVHAARARGRVHGRPRRRRGRRSRPAARSRATCRGTFVAVKPGHPAYHRW